GLTAALRRFRLAPQRVPTSDLQQSGELGDALAHVRLVAAAGGSRQVDELPQADRLDAARLFVARGIARGSPQHRALRTGRGKTGVRAAGADARALEVERGLRDGPAVALAADEVRVV